MGTLLACVILGGCGAGPVGRPYNATNMPVVGDRSSAVLARLGAPFEAFPERTVEDTEKAFPGCPALSERWSYQYTEPSKVPKNRCRTELQFDASGALCNVRNVPPMGPKCTGVER